MSHPCNDERRGISAELAAGIVAYEARIAPLLGLTLTIAGPDGREHTGVFGEAAKCQPIVTEADGRRWLVTQSELARLVREAKS